MDISAHAIALCGVGVVPTRMAMPWFNSHRSWADHEPPLRLCGLVGDEDQDVTPVLTRWPYVGDSRGTNEYGDAVV